MKKNQLFCIVFLALTTLLCNNLVYSQGVEEIDIISYNGASIDVEWNQVDDDGFGYVTFDAANCTHLSCPGITTVKIPVIKRDGFIKGDAVICTGQQYIYRLPAWSGTVFNWSVSGNATLTYTDQPNEVVITPTGTGFIALICDYTTAIAGCSGSARISIEAMNSAIISGDTEKCAGGTAGFTLSNYTGGFTWVIKRPNGSIQNVAGVANNPLNIPNLLAGTYTITVMPAGKNFCPPEPLILKVTTAPAAPDSIVGVSGICPTVPYEFTAGNAMANHEFVWEISQGTGTIQGSSTGSTITAVFTGSGNWELSVKRINMHSPSCLSTAVTKTINLATPTTNITGNHLPCPNNNYSYQVDYSDGENYEWSITPQTAGSVTAGNGIQTVNILWNNTTVPVEAYITIKIRKCGMLTTDTFQVHIGGVPYFSLSNTTVCRGEEFTLPLGSTPAITPGTANVTWNFGDGIVKTGTDLGVLHAYTTLNQSVMNYTISATVTSNNGCMVIPVTVTASVTVNPAPIVTLSPSGAVSYCETLTPFNITASLQSGYGSTTELTWHTPAGNVTCYSPFSCNPLTATLPGLYKIVAKNDYNCTSESYLLSVYEKCLDSCELKETLNITTNSVSCGQVNVTGNYSGTPVGYNWLVNTPPVNYTVTNKTSTNFQAMFHKPGIYDLQYLMVYINAQDDTCMMIYNENIPIPLKQELQYATDCGTGSNYNVTINDKSRYLPGTVFNNYTFSVYDAAGTTLLYTQAVTHPANSYQFALAAGSSYQLEMTVNYTYNGNTESCTTAKTAISLPAKPVANFGFEAGTPATPCEGINVQFVNNSTPTTGVSYHWNFGDLATVLVKNPGRVYSSAGTRQVTLTVQNEEGCTDSKQQNITIAQNELDGEIDPDEAVICEGYSQNLQYIPASGAPVPTIYRWKNDLTPLYTTVHPQNSLSVSTTGYYWVRAEDANKCYFNTPAVGVGVVKLTQPVITGPAFVCENQSFTLTAYVGDPQDITYVWKRDGTPIGTNHYAYKEEDQLTPGTYNYEVWVEIANANVSGGFCHRQSAVFTVTVNEPPAAPVIDASMLDCPSYTLELTATPASGGSFNWSNGMYGNSIYVNNGGYYKVWFTAGSTGCTNSAEVQVDKDPRGYLWIVPTGCYEFCLQEQEITYNGTAPVIPFAYWQWNINTTPYINGSNSVPEPLTIATPGSYSLLLQNNFGCTAESGTVNFSSEEECTPTYCYIDPSLYTVYYEPTEDGGCIVHLELSVNNGNGIAVPYTLTSDVGNQPISAGGILQSGSNLIPVTYTSQDFSGGVTFTLKIWIPEETGEECIFEIPIEFDCGQARMATDTKPPVSLTESSAYSLKAYPNPAQGQVRVAYSYPQQAGRAGSIELYNGIGTKVAAYTLPLAAKGTMPLSLGSLPQGVYLLVLKENGQIKANTKLIIAR